MYLANLIWPAVFLSERYYSWWAIPLGLGIETVVICWLTSFSWGRSFLIAFAANIASAIIGVLLFAWAGLIMEFFIEPLFLYFSLHWAFTSLDWLATGLLAACFSFTIEWVIIRYAFLVPGNWKFFWMFLGANVVTAGVALVSILLFPIKYGPG
ncbi:hypothetical protein DB346_04965 [Verrucomicrobia bacterium LW23]|nr:hypothetical protein DB346_04965 [Verrucomicrobia bacterium LW23]